jgi:DNA mismatch repair protein MutL
MSVINILSPFVADLIAAGEVVERPGSVVKELMENSIDAGARNITVELRGGGSALIKVTDDGCGMSPEDAGIAFLRHATSKLSDERGLEAIGTLGFRGEALAAISSVSRIELLTRQKGAESGTRVTLEAGEIQQMHEAGCREGSSMAVRDLFYNTPARRKFLKSDRAEGANCVSLALRTALGHPEISVRCVRDGKEEFFTPGDGKAASCIYSLLGRELASSMLECSLDSDGVSVSGYISAPHAGRGNRASQFFFVNGRPIRSATLQAAVEQAYKNTLLVGRFPACVIYINVSFGSVDVNVHPTKNEVKFSEEKKIFDAVYYAAMGALSRETGTAEISLSPRTEKALSPTPARREAAPAKSAPAPAPAVVSKAPAPSVQSARPVPREDFWGSMTSAQFRAEKMPASPKASVRSYSAPIEPLSPKKEPAPAAKPEPAPEPVIAPEIPSIAEAAAPEEPMRIVGETLDTYIIVEKGDGLILIDKHAAHERIIFDRLRASTGEIMSQSLLAPIIWRCGGETLDLLEKNAEMLSEVGFEVEAYGEDCAAIRAVPADMEGTETAALEEICEKLSLGGTPESMRDEVLHTVACKAAIKAGSRSDPAELEALARRVVSGEIKYCPHGRPVAVTLTKRELDKQFKRIV